MPTHLGLQRLHPIVAPIFTPDALPATTLPIYPGLGRHQMCWLASQWLVCTNITIYLWSLLKVHTLQYVSLSLIIFLKCCILQGLSNGINIRWGLFMPNGSAMKAVAKLVDEGKVMKLYL